MADEEAPAAAPAMAEAPAAVPAIAVPAGPGETRAETITALIQSPHMDSIFLSH